MRARALACYMIFCVRLGSCSGVFSGALVLCSLVVTFGDFFLKENIIK
jgi:hypothetical protein